MRPPLAEQPGARELDPGAESVTSIARPFPTMSHFDPSWCARINAHRRREPDPAPPAADPAPPDPASADAPSFRLREIPKSHTCEICGTVMYDHHCKIVCPNCGYKRDCSDP